ncbi:uncharacterized protein I303_105506 [Kwoniella dejecticola CBS 10117]|uniref:Uncharacterized protein n=1 Tax=Kwoniella dejecticola CBS 10117 TaxID=1296121 RepID=A0A1A6A2C5_9TREE|nr:uncharacterized protein I303_05051 [Kwoniella dejecticola CBS 10117]OBR84194.1 hypothetical protein I303_05051 [Kwoniella dejecticola CBS 10117]
MSLHTPLAMSAQSQIQESAAISAYHASVSQHIHALLQSHNASCSTSSSPKPSSPGSRSPSLPDGLGRRRSTIKASHINRSQPEAELESQPELLEKEGVQPDLLKVQNIGEIDTLNSTSGSSISVSGSSKTKDHLSSRATARSSKTNSISTTSQAESNCLSDEKSLRGRSRTIRPKRHVSSATVVQEQENKGRHEYERSESYDAKRKLRFAKHRADLISKIDSWWKGVKDALPEGSSLADIPPEIVDTIPSPSIPHAVMRRSSDQDKPKNASTSSSTPSKEAPANLPPLTLYGKLPSKNHQLTSPPLNLNPNPNANSNSRPVDFLPSPSLGLGIGIGFAFTIEDPYATSTSMSTSFTHPQQQTLTFSNKACKATFKCMNPKSSLTGNGNGQGNARLNDAEKGTQTNGIDKEWIIDVLGKSADWDIPFDPSNPDTIKNKSSRRAAATEGRSRSPMKVLVTGEMPTPKPIVTGASFWG